METPTFTTLPPEALAARKRRSLIIAIGLIAFVVLIFFVTLAHLQGSVLNRPM